jgi:hypothetical protein
VIYDASLEGLTLAQIEAAIGTAPTLTIFAGAQPAATTDPDPDDPLVAIVLPSDWLAAESGGGASMLGGPWLGLATADGVALSWRISKDSTCYLQGSAGHRTSSAEMRLRNHNLKTDQVVQVTQFRLSTGPIQLAAIAVTESTDSISMLATTSTAPPVDSSRVQLGQVETSYSRASTELRIEWEVAGGTWLDLNNTLNGTEHRVTGTIPVGATSAVFNIGGIDGDLFMKGLPPGSATPGLAGSIDGVAVEGWWIGSGSADPLPLGSFSSSTTSPAFYKNRALGSTLTLTWTNPQTTSRSITINKAVGPVIPTYERDTVERLAPTLYDIEPDSFATLDAFFEDGTHYFIDPWRQVSYGVESNGLKYVRLAIPDGGNLGANGRKSLIPYGNLTEVYLQYSMLIESSAWDNINENGIKLPGPTDSLTGIGPSDELSWRSWHGPKSQNNRDVWGFSDYRYSASAGPGFAPIAHTNALVRGNEWFTITQRIKLNTFDGAGDPVADGVAQEWVNDELIINDTAFIWRAKPTTFVRQWHFNIFHGGTAITLGPMFYRIARFRASTSMIGCPAELRTDTPAAFPEWRRDKEAFVSFDIENTSASSLNVAGYGTNAWNGCAVSDDGRLFAACNGGHASDQAEPGIGNPTLECDLTGDGPSWVKIHEGTPPSRRSLALGDGEVAYRDGPYGSGTAGANIIGFNASRLIHGTASGGGRVHYPGGEATDTTAVPVPANRHSYYSSIWMPADDMHDGRERVMLMQAMALRGPNGGTSAPLQTDGFKIADRAWDHPGNYLTPPPGDGFWSDCTSGRITNSSNLTTFARDSRTGFVYCGGTGSVGTALAIFSAKTPGGAWYNNPSQLPAPHTGTTWTNSSNPGWNSHGAFIDETRDRWVCIKNRVSGQPLLEVRYFPLNGGAMVRINISDNFQHVLGSSHPGITHCLDDDKYWFCIINVGVNNPTGHDQYWRIDPVTGAAELMEQLTTSTPKGPCNGFKYIEPLGGIVHFRNIGGGAVAAQNLRFIPTR